MPLPAAIARFNKHVANHVTARAAGRLPGFGIVTHKGRRSGRVFRTPVKLFSRPGGYDIALIYGRGDWVQNVIHAGGARLVTRGRERGVTNPRIVTDPRRSGVPLPVRPILRLLRVEDFLRVDVIECARSAPVPPVERRHEV